MTIKRYTATADNTITNAFKSDLTTRHTGSNAGAADTLEVFSIYGQASATSEEASRILVNFNIPEVTTDRAAGTIPASGSVKFYLKMYNATHNKTTPKSYTIAVQALSQSWEEGNGLDLDTREDLTYDSVGSNWIRRSGVNAWATTGSSLHTVPVYNAEFDKGTEDLELDITTLVEEWLTGESSGGKDNYGLALKMSGSYETGPESYYTKKFFARSSEFFFKRPTLEARWDDSIRDDRGYFYASSSLAPEADNHNTLYLRNYVRGKLTNIPYIETGLVYVDLYSTIGDAETAESLCNNTPVTGGYYSEGVYTASVCISTTESTLRDVWHNGSGLQYHTGTISVNTHGAQDYNFDQRYITTIKNLKSYYNTQETTRFRLYTRPKDWSPTIYTKANATPENVIISSSSYELFRVSDNLKVVPFGTGSDLHTVLSHDVSGNYFDLDLSILEQGYSYGIRLAFYSDSLSDWEVQPYEFKFKVRQDEY
jgi:hypothetical protein